MIENEKQLQQESIKTGLIGCVVAFIVSILLKRLSVFCGFTLGFILSQLIYMIDCKFVDGLLSSKMTKTYAITLIFFIFKMGIYAIGFLLAVKIPVIFSIFSVAVGYLITKVTIYRLALTRR